MRIVLIGFMGSGKTTIGSLLAHDLTLPFIEMDPLIVEKSGLPSIKHIFDKHGEERFRQLETEVAGDIRSYPEAIISTGGGVVTRDETMKALLSSPSRVVYLEVSFETIAARLRGDEVRPLFSSPERAKELYLIRAPLYRRYAEITIAVDHESRPADTACKIKERLSVE